MLSNVLSDHNRDAMRNDIIKDLRDNITDLRTNDKTDWAMTYANDLESRLLPLAESLTTIHDACEIWREMSWDVWSANNTIAMILNIDIGADDDDTYWLERMGILTHDECDAFDT